MHNDSANLFFTGNYKKVISSYQKAKTKIFDPYVLGAFSFSGQINEAELYFAKFKKNLTPSDLAKVYFFLVIGWTRHSQYDKAKQYLYLLFNLRRKIKTPEDRFFLFQSFGFYRHLGCRFNKSLLWSKLSQKHSFNAEFLWGQILAYDLLGHSQVQTSFIQQGLKNLAQAQNLASLLKLSQTARTLEISILCYRGQFGLDPQNIASRLEKSLRLSKTQDSYSKSNLILELCRQYTLRGQLKKASQLLLKSQEQILAVGHRRQKALYFLRQAHLNYYWRKEQESLRLLTEAERQLDLNLDLSILAQIKELQSQMQPNNKAIQQEIKKLHEQIGHTENNPEDHLGQLLKEAKNFKNEKSLDLVHKILDSECFILLHDLKASQYSRCLVMDLLPGSLTFIDQEEIVHINECLTLTLKKALTLLSEGEVSKENFIEKLWGYKYDPLRHDASVYALINRLKKMFAQKKDWIELSSNAYHLKPATEVVMYAAAIPQPVSSIQNILPQTATDLAAQLNLRQLKALHYLNENESLSVKLYSKIFAVTAITANRDLTSLWQNNYIQRIGRGRATVYVTKV